MNYEFTDPWGEIISSNLCSVCKLCKQDTELNLIAKKLCQKTKVEHKVFKTKLDYGELYTCSGLNSELNSNRIFKDKIEVLKDVLLTLYNVKNELKKNVNQDTKRLLHNVTTLNGHNIQELYALVSQESLTQDINSQINIIEREISGDINQAARTFLRIAKNNAALKTEFSVFKKLFDVEPSFQTKKHYVRKVVLNLLHIFFQDFTDLDVRVKVAETDRQINIDYESIHVALYHFFDNAVKYCAPGEVILITFDDSDYSFFIKIDMISLEIEPDEVQSIFEEGYCGRNAIAVKKNGDGIGLSFISRILKFNNAQIRVRNNVNTKRNKYIQGVRHTNNVFEFHFNY